MSDVKTAACLYGTVKMSAALKPGLGACHCSSCRRWCGGPLMSVHAEGAVEVTAGAEAIKTYASSDWAERAFCGECGSGLYYHLQPSEHFPQGEYIVSACLFDDQTGFKFDHEVFVDGNPGWYSFSGEETRNRMTEADVFAMFAPKEEG